MIESRLDGMGLDSYPGPHAANFEFEVHLGVSFYPDNDGVRMAILRWTVNYVDGDGIVSLVGSGTQTGQRSKWTQLMRGGISVVHGLIVGSALHVDDGKEQAMPKKKKPGVYAVMELRAVYSPETAKIYATFGTLEAAEKSARRRKAAAVVMDAGSGKHELLMFWISGGREWSLSGDAG